MNDQPSSLGRNDDGRSSSPKRKKLRQKYAPKACVLCRRSKLKCSGDNPCQRCRDNGKRCFFSEDQTAAEALQNLSRPSLAQQPSTSTSTSNGSGLARRNIMTSHQDNERRASDAGALGLSMEARMARVEAMMEALLHERAMYTTPSRSIERDDSGSDIPMPMPVMDPINPASLFLAQPSQTAYSQDSIDPLLGTDTISLRLGRRSFLFPVPTIYQNYIDTFFRELQVYHPCVHERLFRLRSEKMLAKAEVHSDDACFLALNYIIFALHVASTEIVQPGSDDKPAGWHWLQLADDAVGKRQLYGQGDISLAQFLLLKSIYSTLVDQPSLAYNTIGLASRYVLQQGLNRQASRNGAEVWESFERLQVFWNVLIADRRISLSCGRPYTIRDTDIDVERPSDMYQRDIVPNLQPSGPHAKLNETNSGNAFLSCMIDWSRFAGSLWDGLLAAHVSTDTFAEKVTTFDAAITDFLDSTFRVSKAEFMPPQRHSYIHMSFDNLRLMARRATLTSLHFDRATVHDCSRFSMETLVHVKAYEANIKYPLTCILRHHILPTLAGNLLLLCSLCVSDLSDLDLSLDNWIPMVHQTFDTVVVLLHGLAQEIPLARRVLRDFERIVPVAQAVLARWSAEAPLLQGSSDWSIVKDMVPPNVIDFIPYKEQVPDIRFPTLYSGLWATSGGYLDTDRGFATWDEGLEPGGARSSVLWI